MTATDERDGRRSKRIANRQAVIDALLGLYREGHYHPSTAEIADRAAVSQRSVFRYFEDGRALNRALLEQLQEVAEPYWDLGVPPTEPVAVKAARLAAVRVEQYEVVAPGARAARFRAPRQPGAAAQLAQSRDRWRAQLRALFEPQLAALSPERAAAVATAAEVLVSFESYDQLRSGRDLPATDIVAAFESGLLALFESGAPPQPRASTVGD